MLVVFVYAKVHASSVDAFRDATLENARASLKEAGVVRFDVIQALDDATRFVLVEVYRDEAAPAAHKATAHYERWRDTVAPMMAEPRTSAKYAPLHPEPERWETP